MSTKYWFVFKRPGQRFYIVGERKPINAYKVTQHLSLDAAHKYADEMNRQQWERDYGSLPKRKLPQLELELDK